MPELKTLHIDNVDDFTQDAFTAVFGKLSTYQGLNKLGIELVVFELDTNKEAILNVLKIHAPTLRHISFAKNKCTNAFMKFICEGLMGMS